MIFVVKSVQGLARPLNDAQRTHCAFVSLLLHIFVRDAGRPPCPAPCRLAAISTNISTDYPIVVVWESPRRKPFFLSFSSFFSCNGFEKRSVESTPSNTLCIFIGKSKEATAATNKSCLCRTRTLYKCIVIQTRSFKMRTAPLRVSLCVL